MFGRAPHSRRSRNVPLAALLVVACVTLTACSAGPSDGASGAPADGGTVVTTDSSKPAPGTQTGIADPDDIDPARLAPLAGLQPCDAPPEAPAGMDAGELPLPDAAILTTASTDGSLLTAQGYSERTPVEIMVAYMRLEGWTILNAEDEVFESEILVELDGLRVFAKAQAVCDRGSAFVMFGSTDPALVPAPAGG